MADLTEITNLMFKDYPDIVGVKELQKMLGIKRTKAYEILNNNSIKSIKIGREYKISKVNVALYIMGEKQIWQDI